MLAASVLSAVEPTSYTQAKMDPLWVEAMDKELSALEANDTWVLTSLPACHKAISSIWVYKIKHKPNGSIDRYKARLVIRGFSQQLGIDYKHTFSPVAKQATVRLVIALAASYKWHLKQLDVNNAFLHGFLDEEIYMLPPLGYTKASLGQVCKLTKSLYGLKQASRQWNIELTKFLLSLGFLQSPNDHSLFIYKTDSVYTVAIIYVDDILLTGPHLDHITYVKDSLHDKFSIKDLGDATYFLGMELQRTSTGIHINQRKYSLNLLKDFDVSNIKVTHSPLPQGLKLQFIPVDVLPEPSVYRKLIGRLLYLSLTRPDLSFGIQHLSQFVANLGTFHMTAALHILKYLAQTSSYGLFYPHQQNTSLIAFTDADWTNCLHTRKSISGFCIFLGHALFSWKSKKQATVSRSSTESEYRNMASTTAELHWLSYLLRDFHFPVRLPLKLFCDNKSAQLLAANPCFHDRSKHFDVDFHFTRDQVQKGFLQTAHLPSSAQLVDLFTKSLLPKLHSSISSKLGLQA